LNKRRFLETEQASASLEQRQYSNVRNATIDVQNLASDEGAHWRGEKQHCFSNFPWLSNTLIRLPVIQFVIQWITWLKRIRVCIHGSRSHRINGNAFWTKLFHALISMRFSQKQNKRKQTSSANATVTAFKAPLLPE